MKITDLKIDIIPVGKPDEEKIPTINLTFPRGEQVLVEESLEELAAKLERDGFKFNGASDVM
jgi:hypothetical protein